METSDMAEEAKGLDAHLDAALAKYDANLDPIAEAEPAPEDAAPDPRIKSGEAAPQTPTSDDEPSEGPALDEYGRAHGADGKFVAKPPAKAKHSAAQSAESASAKAPVTPVEKDDTADAPAPQPVEPSSYWSDQLKAQFAQWSPEVQKAFRDAHDGAKADYSRKTQELSEIRKSIEPTLAEVQRHQPFLQAIGYTPDRFIRESAAVAQNLMSGTPQNQGQGIAYLMNMYRIPAEAVLQALGVPLNPGETVQVNPALQQLHQSHLEMSRQLQQLQYEQRSWQYTNALAQFEEIGAQTDANGNRRFPYWDRVKDTMIDLVANGRSESWEKAYDKAVRMDDELYQMSSEAQRKNWVETEAQRRREAVEKARRASPVATTPSTPGGGEVLKGLDAHLRAAMAKHYSD
jgi:hypothetical protein